MNNYKLPEYWDRIEDPAAERKNHNDFWDGEGDDDVPRFTEKQHPIAEDGSGNYLIIDETSGKPVPKFWYHDWEPHTLQDASRRDLIDMGFPVGKYSPTEMQKKLLEKGITSREQINSLSNKELQYFQQTPKPHSKAEDIFVGGMLGFMGAGAIANKFAPQHLGKAALGGAIAGAAGYRALAKRFTNNDLDNRAKNRLKNELNDYNYNTDNGKYAEEGEDNMDKVAYYKEQIMEKVAGVKLTPEQKAELSERQQDARAEMRHEVRTRAGIGKRIGMEFKDGGVGALIGVPVGALAGAIAHKKLGMDPKKAIGMGAAIGGGVGFNGGAMVGGVKGTLLQAKTMKEHAQNRFKDDHEDVKRAAGNGGYILLNKAEKIKYLLEKGLVDKEAFEAVDEFCKEAGFKEKVVNFAQDVSGKTLEKAKNVLNSSELKDVGIKGNDVMSRAKRFMSGVENRQKHGLGVLDRFQGNHSERIQQAHKAQSKARKQLAVGATAIAGTGIGLGINKARKEK